MLQNEPVSVSKSFKYLGIFFNEKGIDTDACVNKLGNSMKKAALALIGMGLRPRNYPLHIIANHFRVFVRSCGEYSLAILPLTKAHIQTLEKYQYNALQSLIITDARVSRVKLLACLDLETVELRYNILSAKWLHDVQNHKGPDFLVTEALNDFLLGSLRNPGSQELSCFYSPYKVNPVLTLFHNHCNPPSIEHAPSTSEPVRTLRTSTRHRTTTPIIEPASVFEIPHELHEKQSISTFCSRFKEYCRTKDFNDNLLPIPPPGYSIAKTLHSLGVPRGRLRFVVQWMCGFVPHIRHECFQCNQLITKAHLELCVVRSSLPNVEAGKRIDNLLNRAVNELHAPSALLVVKILYKEVTLAFPPRLNRQH